MTIKVTKIAVHVIKCDLDIPFAFLKDGLKKDRLHWLRLRLMKV